MAAAIGRFMALLDLAQNTDLSGDVPAKLDKVLATGVHDPTLGFTDAYFHTAAELRHEIETAAFHDTQIVGIEGPAWMIVDSEVDSEQRFQNALLCARLTEHYPQVVDVSAHLMAIAFA